MTYRFTLVVLLATFTLGPGCGHTDEPAAEARSGAGRTDELRVHDYEVELVRLTRPIERTDPSGRKSVREQAWFVFLRADYPAVRGPVVDVYLGEERIPEYGGWREGIYFRVYDPARLEALDGTSFFSRIGREAKRPCGPEFRCPELRKMTPVAEADVRRRRR